MTSSGDLEAVTKSSPGRTRTSDKAVNSRLLYQLSYRGCGLCPSCRRTLAGRTINQFYRPNQAHSTAHLTPVRGSVRFRWGIVPSAGAGTGQASEAPRLFHRAQEHSDQRDQENDQQDHRQPSPPGSARGGAGELIAADETLILIVGDHRGARWAFAFTSHRL